MSDALSKAWDTDDNAKQLAAMLQEVVQNGMREYRALARRYDDALRRINDLTAELEALRTELGRKA